MDNGQSLLEKEAYTSLEWFKKEQALIFGNTWQFAGLEEDLKAPGDFLNVQCGLQNIMVIRGEDHQLKAFHNLCRHRGAQLLRPVGKSKKVLVCPYHDWVYNLDGQLIKVPGKDEEFPGLDLSRICLHKASVGIWRGIIWVHSKPDAPALTTWFEGLSSHLGPHNPERLIEYPGTNYDRVVNANWKILVENYIDVYHLSHLHSHTLKMYDHTKAVFGFKNNHFYFHEPLAEIYQAHLDRLIPYKRIAEMTDPHLGAYVPWLFPTLGLSESECMWNIFHLEPLTPETTRVRIRTKMEPMSQAEYDKQAQKSEKSWSKIMGKGTKFNSKSEEDPFASWDFMEEDIYACEQQQRAMNTPLPIHVHYAAHREKPIVSFQQLIRHWLTQANHSEETPCLIFSSDTTERFLGNTQHGGHIPQVYPLSHIREKGKQ
ncbi:MAG: aromatic ring-hydroxylating dioxygenase subunit alpha [Roseivirga sp.]|nr:aromatic ring-hydroxylating dioxygenase subunit alpha [Roseivirga sp.]